MVRIALLNKKGYTLIETLIAMLIFSLVLIFMLQGFTFAYRLNFQNVIRQEAIKIAQNEVEFIRNMDFDKIYDINNDGIFKDKKNRTDCPTCSTKSKISQCVVTRRIRNAIIKFGKKVIVTQDASNPDILLVTVTTCTDYKEVNTGNNIQYSISTVIAKEK